MHEYGITRQIIKIANGEANKAGGYKVLEIRLVIGELSAVVDESVQMYFDVLSKGTLADGAKLVFRKIPAQFHCSICNDLFLKPPRGFDCPKCGKEGNPTEHGREFHIESLLLDD